MSEEMIQIRSYRTSDWPLIEGWWRTFGGVIPSPAMMPEESSFVAEIDGVPALAVSLYLTNTPELSFVENLIGNPALKGAARREATVRLFDHMADFAKARGFKHLAGFTEAPALIRHYESLGFKSVMSGLTALARRT